MNIDRKHNYKENPKIKPLSEIASDAFKKVEQLSESRELITGVTTGIDRLDEMTAGLQPGQLIILGGSDGSCKTNLSLHIAIHAAHNNVEVVNFSWMSNEQTGMKLLCLVSEVSPSRLWSGWLEDQDWPKLVRATGMLSDMSIHICDLAYPSVDEMIDIISSLKKAHDVGLIIIDYLQLIHKFYNGDFNEELQEEVLDSLKRMAVEFSVPVLLLCHLKKPFFDIAPQLTDLMLQYERSVARKGDTIIFSHREEESDTDPSFVAKHEIIIAQQLNGPTGVIELSKELARKIAFQFE
jgi:replicative DNA helicase